MTDAGVFEAERPRLTSLAYRMLGERAAAEDVVQDAWLRWSEAKDANIRDPRAWLTTVTTRLAIDALRSARARRETYVGPWLPEPLIDEKITTPEEELSRVQTVELALLYVLERLGPEERAAYLLRETFDTGYGDLAGMLGRSEDAVRQMVSRAKKRLGKGPRATASFADVKALLEKFVAATTAQNEQEMLALLAPESLFVSDGGGKVSAALRILDAPEDILMVWRTIAARHGVDASISWASANGLPALMIHGADQTTTLLTAVPDEAGRISFLYVMRNPDKLAV